MKHIILKKASGKLKFSVTYNFEWDFQGLSGDQDYESLYTYSNFKRGDYIKNILECYMLNKHDLNYKDLYVKIDDNLPNEILDAHNDAVKQYKEILAEEVSDQIKKLEKEEKSLAARKAILKNKLNGS